MTHIEPQISDTAKLPIGKAAELLGVSRTTLLNHTNECLIKCGTSRKSSRKFYYGSELKRYWKTLI